PSLSFYAMPRRPPGPPGFPYTTLFRSYHRMAVAIEEAGFEIRDRIRFDQSFDTKFGPLLDSLNDEQRGMLLELLNDYVGGGSERSEEHTSELQSRENLVCRLLLAKKNT